METLKIQVDNLKCGGCANTIKNGLKEIQGVESVNVNPDEQWVEVKGDENLNFQLVLDSLRSMGYPKTGTTAGLEKIGRNLQSYVSCAIGRMGGENKK